MADTAADTNRLPLSILNYFAAFTETRFNFRTLINYRWTNDELTLDLSLFRAFSRELFERIKSGTNASLSILPDEHTLSLPGEDILIEIEKALTGKFDPSFLSACIVQEAEKLNEQQKAILISEDGTQAADDATMMEPDEKLRQKAFREGTRKYNRTIRKQIESILIDLQDKYIERLKQETGIEHVPASIFNPIHYLNRHFDALQLLAADSSDEKAYCQKLPLYFRENIGDVVLYDLFILIQKYARFNATGTQYLFFHELNKRDGNGLSESYPIFFVEVDFVVGTKEIVLSFPRNLILINTPAVNYFKFPSVLTTPRSSTWKNAVRGLGEIEVFLQAQYGWTQPFVLESEFKQITAPEKIYPDIKCRISFQVVRKEDKKLLDYSEIMTLIASSGSSKFNDFISQYIGGNVENTKDAVDKQYNDHFPLKSPKRFISDNPLNLNSSQKRILLSLENHKNKIIVVDGPPGTGKSHTIAALMYWANQENRSVVITSHKKEALDVIDRMLTDKFKGLHPKAKPSIVRMGKNGRSLNTIENTFQNSVINAAGDRANEYNESAAQKDLAACETRLAEKLQNRLTSSDGYEAIIKDLFEFERIQAGLIEEGLLSEQETLLPRVTIGSKIDFEGLVRFASREITGILKGFDITFLDFLLKRKSDLPLFLNACEEINVHAGKIADIEIKTHTLPAAFSELVEKCLSVFKPDVPLHRLNPSDIKSAFIRKLLNKVSPESERIHWINSLKSLEYGDLLEDIARLKGVSSKDLLLKDISSAIPDITMAVSLKKHLDLLSEFRGFQTQKDLSLSEIHAVLKALKDSVSEFSVDLFHSVSNLFSHYGPVLSKMRVTPNNLASLSRLPELTLRELDLWKWIQLHFTLSGTAEFNSLSRGRDDLEDYGAQKQKQVEHLNDLRLKNLNNFLGHVARIKVCIEGGKRLTSEQARVLLENISGIIAEPDTISNFFPMEENMIDLLIIDEASQVSIANSISLILRAKQVVVFGDEYQYGAVSAVNVSSRYSASYFREIVAAYSHDYQVQPSEEETRKLIDEVSMEIDDEDLETSPVLSPRDGEGAILWLKTFDIRTSTLNFSKAVANYTTSLRDHYRSFPEIIDYSNEVFYKPAQLELMVNRIRTKPIQEVLQFIFVETKGNSGRNVNLDEIDAIVEDMNTRIGNGFRGSIGVITSFREQQTRMEQALRTRMNMPELIKTHHLAVWFVGDVQGEERDLIYYSFVEDKKYANADLKSIYPVVGGAADTIRSLKMQRLNVGFSRAKDTMVFVHSMPIPDYSATRLGDALKHYEKLLAENSKSDFFVEDPNVFDSPAEKNLYQLLLNTDFVRTHRENLSIIPQFKIGDYIKAEFQRQIPKYRVDFLMTFSRQGKEKSLILEYDGVEFHTKNPETVTKHNFSFEYLDYDIHRQIELESYGYQFLRLNKFNLRPEKAGETSVHVIDRMLALAFEE